MVDKKFCDWCHDDITDVVQAKLEVSAYDKKGEFIKDSGWQLELCAVCMANAQNILPDAVPWSKKAVV